MSRFTPSGDAALRRSAPGASALLAAALLVGCTGPATPGGRSAIERSCLPAGQAGAALPEPAPLPEAERQAVATRLAAQGFSPTAIGIAEVIGALPALGGWAAASPAAELSRLRLRQAITERILLAMLDVSATLAEIDCEGERGDQLRERLQRADSTKTRRLGLAGVMVGALTAALSGGLSLANAATGGDAVGLVGGVAEASVGATGLFVGTAAPFRTPRNMLAEIRDRPARSALFPPVVWRYLNRPGPGGSLAETLAAEWGLGAEPPERTAEDRARLALLLDPGGDYTVEDLEARDGMLDLIETSVARMSQELRALLAALLS